MEVTPQQALAYAVQVMGKKAEVSEERIQGALAPLVSAATDPEESRRHAAVAIALQKCVPAVLRRLIDRLVDALAHGGQAVCRQAAASLVQVGPRAVPVLTHRLKQARSAAVQQRVVAVLAEITVALNSGHYPGTAKGSR